MKKILYVTDVVKLDPATLDFACYLCNLSHSKLTGIFLENLRGEARSGKMLKETALEGGINVQTENVEELKEQCLADNIQLFKDSCEKRGVTGIVHRDLGIPLEDVVMESRYADLLLIDAATSFSVAKENVPTRFVTDVLADAECPVVILPESFEGLNKIVFTYDGRGSSVFAIKQFTQLFPELKEHPVVVITVMEDKNKPSPEERYKLKEWLHDHYSDVDFIVMDGNVKTGLLDSLLLRDKDFIVMGAYGRNAFSTLFTPSHAAPILKLIAQPVFIAHQ
ncbi:universal stress protein [Chitinophaga filiformis]|uniref:Universal stress protein n=1 Tax=Chitinophaga filiformis TaxID=104663 RepID=A0ABY4IDJ4_CHIFI|nr:universal stress protein [Chitinophaga filiformis]UPK72721.1 universal stress protein [Chitinophaga filiformis]